MTNGDAAYKARSDVNLIRSSNVFARTPMRRPSQQPEYMKGVLKKRITTCYWSNFV